MSEKRGDFFAALNRTILELKLSRIYSIRIPYLLSIAPYWN
ncbi:hypothetical protein PORCAN_1220 [Porphyromonas crevioricanis JCM 13913]|nr:hypothetical protein PORCAN_1220 [Porphyromonas crevioricanis JCM 13913]